jgi:hypothetical protein
MCVFDLPIFFNFWRRWLDLIEMVYYLEMSSALFFESCVPGATAINGERNRY